MAMADLHVQINGSIAVASFPTQSLSRGPMSTPISPAKRPMRSGSWKTGAGANKVTRMVV